MGSRRRRTIEQWQALVEEQRKSGLSATTFCRERNLCDASFYAWRKRLSQSPTVATESAMPFIDLSTLTRSESTTRWQVELELGDGLVLRLGRH